MKFVAVVAALVGFAAAQTLSSLPKCGQDCINGMLQKAPSLGCSATDEVCLCKNVDFQNGVHDCVVESCPAGTNTTAIIDFGTATCNAALANVTAITTKPIVSTESGGSKTTIGSTTIYSSITGAAATSASSSKASEASKSASASSEASAKSASASSVASSAEASASSVAASASSAASSVAASASSAVESSASSAASSSSSQADAMPMVTVAAQAFVGMAGLAAAFAL